MANWENLFDRARSAQSLRSEALQKQQDVERARQEFDRWVIGIVPRVLADVAAHAAEKASDFENHTGSHIDVLAADPSRIPNTEAPWLSYMKLSLETSLLYIYATRGGSSRLYIHMMPDDASWAQKNQRVISHAGCFIVRSDPTYELHYLRGDPEGEPKDVMPMDSLVYRAFDLLVTANVQRNS